MSRDYSPGCWLTRRPLGLRAFLTVEVLTTAATGLAPTDTLEVEFIVWGDPIDPVFAVGFRVPWRRPRPWELELEVPGGIKRWKWRERAPRDAG